MSNTHKEGVHDTCVGVDGYRVELGCHAGSQHSTCESEYDIERIGGAAALDRQVDGLIPGNPRSAPPKTNAVQRCADAASAWTPRRAGNRQCL
ncbi:MAG: hypothetical protein IT353_06850 [Gemmatimonadaceae bacterium]|uniref:hypothetical protein n=1 Tax=Hydrogenophaga taeniospiralis TaxID=65656 RepID=UPI001CF98345|nr:hypothetical protein [Hydrogenophaga taeniospiralis]MCC6242541.1 hypothetical protein [Gemmatimonadaceae bacterium]UCU96854.1 hypothetical protein KI616_13910 [Hydrogenophaga taeniospiralis]